ncbi:MAG: carboxypeptidase regulatory-like domain-containing protein, partial [bacterium]
MTIATDELFFPEVRADISAALSEAWYDAYFAELDGVYQQWFPVLNELGVEMLFIPGSNLYTESPILAPYVDQKLRDQVAFVRSSYGGLLTSDWVMGPPFTFYSDLDYVGTKWDSQIDPRYVTPDDFAAWLDLWAEEELDALFVEYGKPVLVGLSWASYDGAAQLRFGGDDPEISEYEPFTGAVAQDLQVQADLFGASLQILAQRPWIKGTFLFGYSYWTSVDLSPGVRGKPAEDLFRQWYTALNRPGVATTVPSYVDVGFTAHVPANTPPGDQVYLVRTTFFEPHEVDRIPMADQGGGTWSVTVSRLLDGALLRYVYDRGWTEFDRRLEKREAFGADLAIVYRHILVSGATPAAEDTVAMWADLPLPSPQGTLNGSVREAGTGLPVWDATVSVAGVHTATDHDGNFTLTNLSGGTHRVTITTARGVHRPATSTVTVTEGSTTSVTVDLVPAVAQLVTFDVVLPSDSPLDAVVRILGNHHDLGSVAWSSNQLSASAPRGLVLTQVATKRYTAALTLYEGTYVEYEYSLGDTLSSSERSPNGGDIRLREFVVGSLPQTRADSVVGWRVPPQVALTFNVTLPPNTPPREPIYMRVGPLLPMSRVDPLTWTFTYYGFPGQVFTYEYNHGAGLAVGEVQADGSPVPVRSVTLPSTDSSVEDTVVRWQDFPLAVARTSTEQVNVTFRVAVPLNTPANETVYVEWSSLTMGSDSVALTPIPTNRWIWEGRLTFPAPGSVTYGYARGAMRVPENGTRAVEISHENQVVTDGVAVWSDLPPVPLATNFPRGIGPEDYWSVDFFDLYDPLLDSVEAQNAEWVVVSSIWSYGRINPLPTVEPRPLRADSVFATTEDLLDTIAKIHAHGLKAFIVPQFNMELTPGGDALFTAHNNSGWAAWLDQARRLYLYNAVVAEQAGAEMRLLPGPTFHV